MQSHFWGKRRNQSLRELIFEDSSIIRRTEQKPVAFADILDKISMRKFVPNRHIFVPLFEVTILASCHHIAVLKHINAPDQALMSPYPKYHFLLSQVPAAQISLQITQIQQSRFRAYGQGVNCKFLHIIQSLQTLSCWIFPDFNRPILWTGNNSFRVQPAHPPHPIVVSFNLYQLLARGDIKYFNGRVGAATG